MATTNAGQLVSLQIGGVDYDPLGEWTITPSFIKSEHKESTRKDDYFGDTVMPGKLSGDIAIREDQDTDPVRNARNVEFFCETAAGAFYGGNVNYTADGEEAQGDGKMQVELTGRVDKQ